MFSLNHLGLTVGSIPSLVLIFVWFCLLRWVRYSGWGIAILTLIGTISHEVLHAAVGWVVYAKPTSFSIIPRRGKNYWMLGSVGFRNLNIWNSAPVAFAPLLLAWVSWLIFNYWTQSAFQNGDYMSWIVSGYVAAVALFSCLPSHIDIKMGALSALMYGCIACLIWLGVFQFNRLLA
ncbi:hypothetical protein D0T25_10350 [Duganella sp. BJB488]|uniref:hypothetical protein n=1 Tax=unclassified Duganella TaxID=2636909 RepID=UPI000E342455|nr:MULTISPECIES: hypothetical protein [unclassified Duganella]RFP21646.1 hypothetical protein D0T26_10390 [Duganella sp. BJB489]RFP23439.1 hypothetical protein D0T25_10350 [Duganella sp. BJB488]RFP38605.1 hypothetical protein D0T24_03195 [Duganella sp. BJB480]